jgi:hypothetical protein
MINIYKDYKTRDGKPVRALKEHTEDETFKQKDRETKTGRRIELIIGQVFMLDDLLNAKGWCTVVWDEFGQEAFGRTELDLVEASKIKVKNKQTALF